MLAASSFIRLQVCSLSRLRCNRGLGVILSVSSSIRLQVYSLSSVNLRQPKPRTTGVGSLVCAVFVKPRKDFFAFHGEYPPSNLPLAATGAGNKQIHPTPYTLHPKP